MANQLQEIEKNVFSLRETFNSMLVSDEINFESEARFAMQYLRSNDRLMNTAIQNKESLYDAIRNVATIGITLNPAMRQAYLVPRDNKVCLDIGYIGLKDIATMSGSILWVRAVIVYENDQFEMSTPGEKPYHKYDQFSKDRGKIIGCYCIAKLPNGDFLVDAMSISEIEKTKARSKSANSNYSPWKTDYEEMVKKTVVKRAAKMWPINSRLSGAIHHLNVEMQEGIDFKDQDDPGKQSVEEKAAQVKKLLIERLHIKGKEGGMKAIMEALDTLGAVHRSLIKDKDIKALENIYTKDIQND